MATKPKSGLLESFLVKPASAEPSVAGAAPVIPQAEKKRRKQLVFLVSEEQETKLNHLRADLGNIKIQELFSQALNLLLEKHGQAKL